jgi:hypothetical protein
MGRTLGVPVTVRHEGETEEYIEFRSVDGAMRDRFGFEPSIRFEDGLKKLHAFLEQEGRSVRAT